MIQTKSLQFDLVVCGGGLAGVCAAIAAARSGVRVALVEQRPVLGGNSSSMAGVPPHGATAFGHNRNGRETGILEEFRMEYAARTPHADNRQFWDNVLREACNREPNLTTLFNTSVQSSTVKNRRIEAVRCVQTTTETVYDLSSPLFVDATGDALLALQAGATIRMGREGKAEFNETLAPEHPDQKTLGCTIYLIAQKRDYPVPFTPPETAKTYRNCGDFRDHHDIHSIIPGNSLSPDHSNFRVYWWLELGGERHVIHDNESIYQDLLAEMFGIWDHLKNHCTEETREALRNYDLTFWSLIPLKRGSRRVEGDYVFTEHDVFHPKLFPDRIGYGGFPLDLHPPEGLRSTEPPCDQTFVNQFFSVPYRMFYARDVENLFLGGRCLSTSYAALGALRVMYTLGSFGQAIGTAAAICAKGGKSPRELYESGEIPDLQQQLIKDDMYLLGVENEDDSDHARTAQPSATSTVGLQTTEVDGFCELRFDTVQQVPVSSDYIERLEIYLSSDNHSDVTATWSVGQDSELGYFDDGREIASGEVTVRADESGWYCLAEHVEISPEKLLSIRLSKTPGVRWGFTKDEAFGTRWGVYYEGPIEARSFHGMARIAPKRNRWIFVNHHGRLPGELDDELKDIFTEEQAYKLRPVSKPYITMCVRTVPTQYPYSAENVVNGVSRADDHPNIWISDPTEGFPQTLTLSWKDTRKLEQVVIAFDTNLDYEDRMYGMPRERFHFAYPVPECVRDYRISALVEGSWTELVTVRGNAQRRRVHHLDSPLMTRELRIKVETTNGADSARIYEVRVY